MSWSKTKSTVNVCKSKIISKGATPGVDVGKSYLNIIKLQRKRYNPKLTYRNFRSNSSHEKQGCVWAEFWLHVHAFKKRWGELLIFYIFAYKFRSLIKIKISTNSNYIELDLYQLTRVVPPLLACFVAASKDCTFWYRGFRKRQICTHLMLFLIIDADAAILGNFRTPTWILFLVFLSKCHKA